MPPIVKVEQLHPMLSVADVRAAADFYATKLGFIVAFTEGDPPRFAGVNLDCVQMFLVKGTAAPEGSSVYFVIDNVDAFCAFHRANGVDVVESPSDRPYGLREYTVRDLDGYCLNFGQRL
jgi:catechol 2,3-dioxygenase-like lactoylglutathione lyase family enzyme